MKISRRSALISSVATSLAACTPSSTLPTLENDLSVKGTVFAHGVASGDPSQDGFVIWTRVSPSHAAQEIQTRWEVSTDFDFDKIVLSGRVVARPSKDYTVKIELDQLEPGTRYFYRFQTDTAISPIGRSKTLPVGAIETARFAVVSCSNYPFGFFNVYDHIAQQDDLDAVIHLGDYLYEYGPEGYGGQVGAKIGRVHVPAREIVTLSDYRQRHAQYKSDLGSQRMLSAHPLIAIWDDHETTNNSWENGADNHQDNEGDWSVRKNAALQAYYEWMPVREPKGGRLRESLFKTYQWGQLLSLATIETRLTARSKQLEYSDIIPTLKTPADIQRFKTDILGAPERVLMGATQRQYLQDTLTHSKSSGIKWRLIANQVIMADIAAPNLVDFADDPAIDAIEKELPQIRDFLRFTTLGLPLNLDAWDGYPAAREALYNIAETSNVRDLLVLTGDTHEYWVNDLYRQNGQKMGVELGTAGVTSPGASTYFGSRAQDYSDRIVAKNKSVMYHGAFQNGYIDLCLNAENAVADFVTVNTVMSSEYTAGVSQRFDITRKNNSLIAYQHQR